MVSTSVCGTESSGSNPDRALFFGLDQFLRLERHLFFFFLYVRNALAHDANVSTGFPLFQHPKVVSSILPFLHPFSIFWYCACVLVCACALGRDLFSPTCLTCLTRLQIYVHVWLLYNNNSNVLPLCSDDPSRRLPMTSCLICIIMVAE